MNIQTLSSEQMKHLAELGVNIATASLVHIDVDPNDVSLAYLGSNTYMKNTEYSKTFVDNGLAFYVFTLQDVLDRLPARRMVEYDTYTLSITPVSSRLWKISYSYWHEEGEVVLKSFASSLLDASYKMFCWTLMN